MVSEDIDQAGKEPVLGAAVELGELADHPDISAMPPDERRAFYCYLNSNSSHKTGRRSLNRVSDELGIPIGTVRYWHTNHHWLALAASIDKSADVESMQAAIVAAAASRPRIVSRLQSIAFDESGKVSTRDSLTALNLLASMTGLPRMGQAPLPTEEEEERYSGYTESDLARLAASSDPKDRAELMRLATGRA